MSREIPLTENASVVLNGSGNGSVTLGPRGQFQTWYPASVQVQVSSNVLESEAYVFQGSASSIGNAYANTQSGSTGDVCGVQGITLYPGQVITVVWSGGDPGGIATASVFGVVEVPR